MNGLSLYIIHLSHAWSIRGDKTVLHPRRCRCLMFTKVFIRAILKIQTNFQTPQACSGDYNSPGKIAFMIKVAMVGFFFRFRKESKSTKVLDCKRRPRLSGGKTSVGSATVQTIHRKPRKSPDLQSMFKRN